MTMDCRTKLLGLACLAFLLQASAEGEKKPPYMFSGRLAEVREDPDFLGDDWTSRPGLVIDDLRDTSKLWGQSKDMDEALQVLLAKMPDGAIGYAEYKYRKGQSTRYITLRVWVFEKPESARSWWRARYEMQGWERFYGKVAGLGEAAVDSKELKKRIVLIGNVVFACDERPEGESYLLALDRYMAKMEAKAPK
jgi:hypothetical protein